VIRPDCRVELINKKGCDVLGYSKDELEGADWIEVCIPPEDRGNTRTAFDKMFCADEDPLEYYEGFIITKKDELRVVQWHNTYLKDDAGEIIAILSSGEDITFRKALQSKLAAQESEKRKQILAAVLEAQENERHEIAYELHDNVNQILTTCKILLETEVGKKDTSPFITNTYKYLQEAINEIRSLSHRLNPLQLNDLGLEGTIQELIHGFKGTSRFNFQFEVNNPVALKVIEPSIALSLYRITQEQISNIIKHANASFIRISINVMPEYIDLEIGDNGKGFDPRSIARGLGIKNIRNRAEFHKGTSYISSLPGDGCVLSVCIPIAS
jgi:PAS domain S-box-containing protein